MVEYPPPNLLNEGDKTLSGECGDDLEAIAGDPKGKLISKGDVSKEQLLLFFQGLVELGLDVFGDNTAGGKTLTAPGISCGLI